MQKTIRASLHKKAVLTAVVAFLVSYIFFLFLWLQVKDHYGAAVTVTASKLLTATKDVTFEGKTVSGDLIKTTFSPLSRPDMLVEIPVKTSSYTFNAPLTFSLMATLWFFLRRRGKAYSEALLILMAVHLLYVFSLESKTLTEVLIQRGVERDSTIRLFFSQFLWGFTDNMVIRFEPFLIGFYLFIRFGRYRTE
jgi:hypothetical protein